MSPSLCNFSLTQLFPQAVIPLLFSLYHPIFGKCTLCSLPPVLSLIPLRNCLHVDFCFCLLTFYFSDCLIPFQQCLSVASHTLPPLPSWFPLHYAFLVSIKSSLTYLLLFVFGLLFYSTILKGPHSFPELTNIY